MLLQVVANFLSWLQVVDLRPDSDCLLSLPCQTSTNNNHHNMNFHEKISVQDLPLYLLHMQQTQTKSLCHIGLSLYRMITVDISLSI